MLRYTLLKTLTTKEIIDGCKNQKAKYQRLLVLNYSAELITVARRYMPDKMYAEDIVQEALINAFDRFKSYDENKGTLQNWLRKIVINCALKKLNKKCFEKEMYVESPMEITLHPSVYEKLDAEDLLRVIDTLPDGYKQVFNLYAIEGYSHKEIGNLLGIKEASSRSNLKRAKDILRIKIQQQNATSWAKIV